MEAMDQGADVMDIFSITAVPAVAMALGSAAVSMAEPSETVQARLQRFSAGLLVGAVVTEIFPILKRHLLPYVSEHRRQISWADFAAAVLGFAAALLLMYSVKAMDLDDGDSSDSEGEADAGKADAERPAVAAKRRGEHVWLTQGGDEESIARLRMWLARLQAHSAALGRLASADAVDREAVDEEVHGIDFLVDSARRLVKGAEPMDRRGAHRLREAVEGLIQDIEKIRQMDLSNARDLERQLRRSGASLRQVHSAAEKATFRRWAPRALPEKKEEAAAVPLGLIIAVTVDAVIDGMLIGLAGAVASTSGKLMAAATTFEMCFLGYSFACSIRKVAHRLTGAAILALPPIAMIASSVFACVGASYVEHSPAFSGLIAFAMVSVLFLVFQELLVEAHEKEGGEAWHIGLWLYAGLLLSIQSDMLL